MSKTCLFGISQQSHVFGFVLQFGILVWRFLPVVFVGSLFLRANLPFWTSVDRAECFACLGCCLGGLVYLPKCLRSPSLVFTWIIAIMDHFIGTSSWYSCCCCCLDGWIDYWLIWRSGCFQICSQFHHQNAKWVVYWFFDYDLTTSNVRTTLHNSIM